MDLKSLSKLFDESEKRFSITQTAYDKLEKTVRRIGKYIANNEPDVKTYLQGSFSYGTIVRPYRGDSDGDYDIDLVIEFPPSYCAKGPQAVKSIVGDCLEKSSYGDRLDEGKRCWTLDYSDTSNPDIAFHLDVLPSVSANVPDADKIRKTEIRITNRGKNGYTWSSSNPKGYRQWLSAIDQSHCNAADKKPASNIVSDLDRVADPVDCTPLRSAIKILKRSRDVFFSDRSDSDYAPISVIITTVAASIIDADNTKYNCVAPALEKIIDGLRTMGPKNNGSWNLRNPVDPRENFADKWNTDSSYPDAYYAWYDHLSQQWSKLKSADEREAKEIIEELLGLKTDTLHNVAVEKAKPISAGPTTPKSYAERRVRSLQDTEGYRTAVHLIRGKETMRFRGPRRRLSSDIRHICAE